MVCVVLLLYILNMYTDMVYSSYLSMLEQATYLLLKLEFENMVMSMLIINPAIQVVPNLPLTTKQKFRFSTWASY